MLHRIQWIRNGGPQKFSFLDVVDMASGGLSWHEQEVYSQTSASAYLKVLTRNTFSNIQRHYL